MKYISVSIFSVLFLVHQTVVVGLVDEPELGRNKILERAEMTENLHSRDAIPKNMVEHWITQKLDHDDPINTKTWQQRYFVDDTFFAKKDGPIFLIITAEEYIDYVLSDKRMWRKWAETYSALCFVVENRFFGSSRPTNDTSVENLKYLSSEQALADFQHFIVTQNKDRNLINNKWIVFGGAYSGMLAAWMKSKFPTLVQGAVASSAPVWAKIDFQEYYEIAEKSLATSKHGVSCTNAIQQATSSLNDKIQELTVIKDDKIKIEKANNLKNLINLCAPIDPTNKLDVTNLFDNFISIALTLPVIWNNRPFFPQLTIQSLCDIMTNDTLGSSLERLVEADRSVYGGQCMDARYVNSWAFAKDTNWDSIGNGFRQLIYLQCTGYGYFKTISASREKFFGRIIDKDFLIKKTCTDILGDKFDGQSVKRAVQSTNLRHINLHEKLSNTVFAYGTLDPWSALGMKTNNTKTDVTVLNIEGVSNCADMYYSPSTDDPQPLADAKKWIQAKLASWIGVA